MSHPALPVAAKAGATPAAGRAASNRIAYMPALDGLRAVAVLLVIAFHSQISLIPGGFIGVDLFFVLSGALITSLLLAEYGRTGTVDSYVFFLRRVARLVPALFLAVVILGSALFVTGMRFDTVAMLALPILLFISDYTSALFHFPWHMTHTWSLSVEMHYYLVWPTLMVFALRRMKATRLAQLVLGVAVAVWLWRIVAHLEIGPVYAYHATDTRISGLLVGSALALWRWRPAESLLLPLQTAGILVLIGASLGLEFETILASCLGPVVEIASACVIFSLIASDRGPVGRILSHRTLVWLGGISYGVYIWHFPLAQFFKLSIDPPPPVLFAMTTIVSVALAALSFYLVERPARRWMARRLAARASA